MTDTTVTAGTTRTTRLDMIGVDTLTVEATGVFSVSANNQTVRFVGLDVIDGKITNSGTIENTAAAGRAIRVEDSVNPLFTATITNNATGIIQSNDDALQIQAGAVTSGTITLNNSGAITSSVGQAVDFAGGTGSVVQNITNTGGNINALVDDAIRIGASGKIINSGNINGGSAAGFSAGSDGIQFQDNAFGEVTNNTANGIIQGDRHGINAGLNTSVTVNNNAGATIVGHNGSGVGLDGNGTVFNRGTITGEFNPNATDINGNDGVVDGDGDGIDIDGSAQIVNFGIIQGTGAGGTGSDGRANTAEGIAAGGGSITNQAGGSITGAGLGILIDDSATGPAPFATLITNLGSISGTASFAVKLIGSQNDTVINFGTISGGGGVAMLLGGGNDRLDIADGSSITGVSDAEGGTDTIGYLDWTTSGVTVNLATGTATGTGGIANFENIDGSNQADTLIGDGNDNEFYGLKGNDTVDGGGGTDTFRYFANRADVTLSFAADGTWTATDNSNINAGTDTLTNIEKLRFSDVTLTAETKSLVVTTNQDIVNPFDNLISLREAVLYANTKANADANTPDVITFDAALAGGTIRLTLGTLDITDSVSIDGDINDDRAGDITITGDTLANDPGSAVTQNIFDPVVNPNEYTDNVQLIHATAELSITGLTLTGGAEANSGGGAIEGTSVTVVDSTVRLNNAAGSGGAISATSLTLTNSVVSENFSNGYGGGIHAGSLTMTGSTVSSNNAQFGGGGIEAGVASIANSTVSANTVRDFGFGGYGGGIHLQSGLIENSTISGNSTAGQGGGITFDGGTAQLVNSTVTGNVSGSSGGGIKNLGGTVTLENSIVLGNSGATDVLGFPFDPDFVGTYTLQGGNILGSNVFSGNADIGDTSATEIFGQTTTIAGGVLAGVLASNGGPVQTVALKIDASNPALDRSNSSAPATDARGEARQDLAGIGNNGSNFADLGAFEAIDQPPVVTAIPVRTSIAENAATGTAIKFASLTIVDSDGNNALSLTGADAALFEIQSDGIYLKPGAVLDFETNPVLDVTLNVATLGNGTVTDPATFAVTDVNEAPTALAISDVLASIAENASTAARRKIADITITDDALGTETLTLTGADASKFEIVDGDLYLRAGVTLDFETNSKLDVTVNVDDTTLGSGIELSRALSVTVTDVLETISGSSSANTLNGTSGQDRINAGAGNDTVNGGGGDDIIQGGAGVDRLTGGTGRDTFLFTSITESGYHASGSVSEGGPLTDRAAIGQRDIITDFTPGFDEIDLSAIDANTNVSGNQAFTLRGTGNFAGAGSLVYRKFDNAGTASDRTIIFADVNGDGRSDFQIELTGLKTLKAGDFVL